MVAEYDTRCTDGDRGRAARLLKPAAQSHNIPMPNRLRFDLAWKFHRGDIESPLPNTHIAAYMNHKAGWARGAARKNFDDSDWREVDLPHDWAVEGPFDRENHLDAGFLPRGVSWYRRHFRLQENDRGRRLRITFDGVATHCTVYVNGHLLHRHSSGYTPFTIDISEVATFGDDMNVIAVRVDATYMEGWWYEGAGIYRHVWLIKSDPLHVKDVFVSPRLIEKSVSRRGRQERQAERDEVVSPGGSLAWETWIETAVENSADETASGVLISTIVDSRGAVVGETQSELSIAAHGTAVVRQLIVVDRPKLWSPDSPALYSANSQIRNPQSAIDRVETPFGYRTIRFDPDDGFFLNDRPLKLLGTCNHQDHAGVGAAVPDSIHEFRIRRLKEMGSNAYRCAHNPPAPELLDACDRLGMLVMDENRTFGSSPEVIEQLQAMVRRDRNHPCVILWSICNEESIQTSPVSAKIARAMVRAVKAIDDTRPVTAAVSGGILNDGCISTAVEVLGINYQLPVNQAFHAKHPRVPLIAAETHSTFATRGAAATNADKFIHAENDSSKAPWGETARETWRYVSARPFIAGLFAWTGFDYRGEPSPHDWPCVNSFFGIMDTCGFAKRSFYLHKAWWSAEPFVEIFADDEVGSCDQSGDRSLTVADRPEIVGRPTVCLRAFTNAESAELFVDGTSAGRKAVDPIEMADWRVSADYAMLRVVVFRGDAIVAARELPRAGPPVRLALVVESHDRQEIERPPADGETALAIRVEALDANDVTMRANHYVRFKITGGAKMIGVGNGDPTCHEPDKAAARSLFNGVAQVIIQLTAEAGEIVLTAAADGLQPATLRLTSIATPPRPFVPAAIKRHWLTDWRVSPPFVVRPDPNLAIASADMNTWQRLELNGGAAAPAEGYRIYRTRFTPPKAMQSTGGFISLGAIDPRTDVFINGGAAEQLHLAGGASVRFPAAAAVVELTLLAHPCGEIRGRVELLADREQSAVNAAASAADFSRPHS